MTLMLISTVITAQTTSEEFAKKLPKMTIEEAELIIPRPALHPKRSLDFTEAQPLDTLDTINEHIKVVLYNDNTWRYVKDPKLQYDAEVFKEAWDDEKTNPYQIALENLPESWSIWISDSLTQYHYPYKGEVFHRGKYGIRRGRRHMGVDLPLQTGDPIYAAFDGKVRISKYLGGYGNLVVIRHNNGLETFYGHLSKRNVEVNEWVRAGQVIGQGGSTGRSTGPHLHFETRYKGYAFDPQWLFDFPAGTLRRQLFVLKRKYFSPYSNFEQDFGDEESNEAEDKKEQAEQEAIKYYTIKSGDTLGHIAIKNHTTVKNLCRLNGIKETTILQIGKKIRVR